MQTKVFDMAGKQVGEIASSLRLFSASSPMRLLFTTS